MRELITLVNIKKSLPGKTFESQMFKHIYEKKKAEGKMGDWVEKSEIESIEAVQVEDGLEQQTVEVVEAVEETVVEDEEELDEYDLMDKDELKSACDEAGLKYTKKATENSLRKKLRG